MVRTARNFIGIFACLTLSAIGLAIPSWSDESGTCRLQASGYSYVHISQRDLERTQDWTYQLQVKGASWKNHGMGWHANGMLASKSKSTTGLYYLISLPTTEKRKRFFEQAENMERKLVPEATFGYPFVTLQAPHITSVDFRDGVTVGKFAGYAVLYTLHEGILTRPKLTPRYKKPHLLTISLSDGCVVFRTTMQSYFDPSAGPWNVLDSLISAIHIERTPGHIDPWANRRQYGLGPRTKPPKSRNRIREMRPLELLPLEWD